MDADRRRSTHRSRHGRGKRPHRLPPAVCAMALLTLAGATGCTADGSDPAGNGKDARPPAPSDTAGLPDACSAWAKAPKGDEPITTGTSVVSAVWTKVDGYLEFEAWWENRTRLVAVDVTADLRVLFNEEDITDQLPHRHDLDPYRPYTIDVMLPDDLAESLDEVYGTGSIHHEMPPSPQWSETLHGNHATTLQAPPKARRWCKPKPSSEWHTPA